MTVPMLRCLLRLDAASSGGKAGHGERSRAEWYLTNGGTRGALVRGGWVHASGGAIVPTLKGIHALEGAAALRRLKAGRR